MQDWQIRVIDERDELLARVQKLENFLRTDKYEELDIIDKALLHSQLSIMRNYIQVLEQRCMRFTEPQAER